MLFSRQAPVSRLVVVPDQTDVTSPFMAAFLMCVSSLVERNDQKMSFLLRICSSSFVHVFCAFLSQRSVRSAVFAFLLEEHFQMELRFVSSLGYLYVAIFWFDSGDEVPLPL